MNSGSATGNNSNATSVKTNTNARQTPADVRGVWGGLHIAIEITESGAEINYDCAHGSITQGIVPDRDGKFVAKGLHVNEHPGPVREGEEGEGEAASYSGAIDGQNMTLTVTLSRTNETIGTFNLTHGKGGRVRKCK